MINVCLLNSPLFLTCAWRANSGLTKIMYDQRSEILVPESPRETKKKKEESFRQLVCAGVGGGGVAEVLGECVCVGGGAEVLGECVCV